MRSGQCTTSGSRMPPPWVFCLYRRSGVLAVMAQPHGKFEWVSGPPMSSIRAIFAAIGSGTKLYGPMALTKPLGPPSWLAPLSDKTSTRVLSSCPLASRWSSTRAMFWSACSSIAAYAPWSRLKSRCSSVECSSQALTMSLRGGSSVPSGTMPSSIWRASLSSRSTSQPRRNRSSYLSTSSRGAWCGAWHAPKAIHVNQGVSGEPASWPLMNSNALSVMSLERW